MFDTFIGTTVWVLSSATYLSESDSDVVGIFESEEAAERYKNEATPPVTDGIINEWSIGK